MLSLEGRCKTLDASANGYVRAEACGVFILQASPASDSTAGHEAPYSHTDGNFIARLVGSAVNQDGRSSSLTAPNGPAQQRVMKEALAGILPSGAGGGGIGGMLNPSDIVALSMHGTGTPLGDPIEVGAAVAVLMPPDAGYKSGSPRAPVAFMSSKSWFGHAEPASGVKYV